MPGAPPVRLASGCHRGTEEAEWKRRLRIQTMKLPDIFPGRKDDAAIVAALIAGVAVLGVYIGSGGDAWSDRRWRNAGGAGIFYVGMLFPGWGLRRLGETLYRRGIAEGKILGEEHGFQRGYATPNPGLDAARRAMALNEDFIPFPPVYPRSQPPPTGVFKPVRDGRAEGEPAAKGVARMPEPAVQPAETRRRVVGG